MRLSQQNLASLRSQFAHYSGRAPGEAAAPLKKILLVGATLEASGALSENDRAYFRALLDNLESAHVSVDPDFEVEIANIDPAYGGEDFLQGRYDADLVMVCFVYDPDKSEKPEAAGPCASSPHHFLPRVWHDSVVKTGARYLCAVSAGNEVGAAHFSIDGGSLKLISDDFPESLYINTARAPEFSP